MTAATDYAWQDQAACIGMDPDGFFPGTGQVPAPEALAACGRCPVRAACLEDALSFSHFADHGYWGGTTREQRREIRRRRRRDGVRPPLAEPAPLTVTRQTMQLVDGGGA